MTPETLQIRPARDADRLALAELLAAVAEERDGIALEPPVDLDERAAKWPVQHTLVALVEDEIVGEVAVIPNRFGFGELGMMVAAGWRGRGVGAALVASAIEASREHGLHKLTLSVFPHNAAAIALYRKFGFVEEGRRREQIRRSTGEFWDLIEMGLLL